MIFGLLYFHILLFLFYFLIWLFQVFILERDRGRVVSSLSLQMLQIMAEEATYEPAGPQRLFHQL